MSSTPAKRSTPYTPPPRHRRIFCNRTLNMRQVRAIGYDMDYTLIHYHTEAWEKRAYEHARQKLAAYGWPVTNLRFDPQRMVRGLIIDTQLGNILKVNTFGYVKQACHGTQPLGFEALRTLYARVVVNLSERRYVFLNTLFSLSEACLYAQLVDKLEAQALPGALGYEEVYRRVRACIDEAHLEGQLKAEIMAHPDQFVELDADMVLALLDQYHAGKKLLLITNSEWHYTRFMMSYVFDRFLPAGMTWRQLFHYILVAARKPEFFTQRAPLFEVVDDNRATTAIPPATAAAALTTPGGGLLKPCMGTMRQGVAYWGGDASLVERNLNLSGDQILYVGDHLYGDVNVSKTLLRWRTALVLRELEADLTALQNFSPSQAKLQRFMQDKEQCEAQISHLRLLLQRKKTAYAPAPRRSAASLQQGINRVRAQAVKLDEIIRPLAEAAAKVPNVHWGALMRAGNDKSHLARQVERYADIYMSRVANFLWQTPYSYMRALRGTLPHDILDTADA